MRKNLDVVTYRNGDIIPEVKDPTQWANLTTGAWCYYNNDPALGAIYGKLYNRAAVVDPRGLAPLGWHIPSDSYYVYQKYGVEDGGAEWKALGIFLGGDIIYGDGASDVAGKMIASSLWNSPNPAATNESGFTGLPGGQRNPDGSFSSIGSFGRWWSTGTYTLFDWSPYRDETWLQYYYVSEELRSDGYLLSQIEYHYSHDVDNSTTEISYPAGYGLSVRCVKD